jgi:hypothetical protein
MVTLTRNVLSWVTVTCRYERVAPRGKYARRSECGLILTAENPFNLS